VTNIHSPTRTKYIVYFKPKNTPVFSASEIRTVSFSTKQDFSNINKAEIYKLAYKYAVKKNVIDKSSIHKHWEPYEIDVRQQSPPSQMSELI